MVSMIGFLFGGKLPMPLAAKFFLGAFGFGTGFVLLIVAKILKVREQENGHEAGQFDHLMDDDVTEPGIENKE